MLCSLITTHAVSYHVQCINYSLVCDNNLCIITAMYTSITVHFCTMLYVCLYTRASMQCSILFESKSIWFTLYVYADLPMYCHAFFLTALSVTLYRATVSLVWYRTSFCTYRALMLYQWAHRARLRLFTPPYGMAANQGLQGYLGAHKLLCSYQLNLWYVLIKHFWD